MEYSYIMLCIFHRQFQKPLCLPSPELLNLQFFSWGVITAPMIKILNSEFGHNALLLNGIIMGVKGFLSFLSAPLIGALSDVYGRKLFLLITAFFTCVPIPFIKVRRRSSFVWDENWIRHPTTWHAMETTPLVTL